MPRIRIYTLVSILIVIGFSSCGRDQAQTIEETPDQIVMIASETATARPSATATLTLTPTATHTPEATPTDPPTRTPTSTRTPRPTNTPEPTETATSTPTNTASPTAVPIVSSPVPAQPTSPPVDQRMQLLTTIENVIRDIDVAKSALWSVTFIGFPASPTEQPTDCPTLVAAYDRIANALVLNTTADPGIQNAYNFYRTAVDSALLTLEPRTTECRGFIASGAPSTIMDQAEYNRVDDALLQPKDWLNQAANDLRQQ